MKKLLLGSISALTLLAGNPAIAADLAPAYKAPPVVAPVPWTWTGFYVGGNLGGGWGQELMDKNQIVVFTAPGPVFFRFSPPLASELPLSGFLGGGQIGYRLQTGMWVWGIEGTLDWADIRGKSTTGILATDDDTLLKTRVEWIATLAAEAGWTVDHALLYLKGGGAAIHVNHTLTPQTIIASSGGLSSTPFSCTSCDDSETQWGWMFGAGVTYAFTNSWSAFLEYNYMNFGTNSATHRFDVRGITRTANDIRFPPNVPFSANVDTAQDIHVLKAGINYKFDWWTAPVVAAY
jgi:outer membrane immunogenic protein